MKHVMRCSLAAFLSLVLVAGGLYVTGSTYSSDSDNEVVYGVASTMNRRTKVTKSETTTDETSVEPYQSLQWALYNDGTFSTANNSNTGNFDDNGTYDGGGFVMPEIPDDSENNPGSSDGNTTWPGNTTCPWNGTDWIDSWMDQWFNGNGSFNFGFSGGNGSYGGSFGGNYGGNGFNAGFYGNYNNSRSGVGMSFDNGSCNIWFYGLSSRWQTYSATTAVADIDTDAVEAWELFDGDEREVIVAIIDTGVDYTHEDLDDVIWVNAGEIAGDGIDNDNNGYIDDVYGWNFYDNNAKVYSSRKSTEYTHGTHVAGTIAAEINGVGVAGVASKANIKLMVIKALGGSEGEGSTEDVIAAIKYAESMGAVICNLSFGTTENDEELYEAMAASNMLFVCAAGNGDTRGVGVNTDETPLYPASYDLDNIISVANLTYDGTLDESSNYGLVSVDIAAPGTEILSTSAAGSYEYLSGTSMAAPMVTAVAASVYSYYGDLDLAAVKEIVLKSAQPLDSLTGLVATGGMVNAYNALIYK